VDEVCIGGLPDDLSDELEVREGICLLRYETKVGIHQGLAEIADSLQPADVLLARGPDILRMVKIRRLVIRSIDDDTHRLSSELVQLKQVRNRMHQLKLALRASPYDIKVCLAEGGGMALADHAVGNE
jgi:hypothetical protein